MQLIAEVRGLPKPHLVWTRKGDFLKSKGDFSLSEKNGEAILSIKQSTFDHSGNYVLKAKNEHGEAVESVCLLIQGKPNSCDCSIVGNILSIVVLVNCFNLYVE